MSTTSTVFPVSPAAPEPGTSTHFLQFFMSPGEYCANLKRQPKWLAAFVVSSIIMLVTNITMLPFSRAALFASLPQGVSAEQIEAMEKQVESTKYIGLAFSPIGVLLSAVLMAMLVVMLMQSISGKGEYKTILALTVHIGMISALGAALRLGTLYTMGGPESIRNAKDLKVAMGLNVLFSGLPPALDSILNSINVMEIWSLCLIVVGLRGMYRISRSIAVAVAGGYWFVTTGFSAGIALILNSSK